MKLSECQLNDFERKIINDVANLSNIEWWHRNLDNRSKPSGFFLNGFINHYPDFIVRTKRGNIILLETKGGHLDNFDSKMKLHLGQKWESACGHKFKYMMVFENTRIEGANRLDEALEELAKM